MQNRLRIAIATSGRFHVLDLARELHALGHEVRFYSCVSPRRAAAFGLPRECHVALLPLLFPLVAWERLLPRFLPALRERLMFGGLDAAARLRLRRCDVLIFMSGMYLGLPRAARRRFGAQLWLERGSQHILAQREILDRSGGERPSNFAIKRELAGYALADRIVIPSGEVEKSFGRDPNAVQKLFRNPYGVDAKLFEPAEPKHSIRPINFIYAGAWSLRKGCDILTEAVQLTADVRLLHVGKIGDFALPENSEKFQHFDAVPQWRLREFYAKADAFVLASREEGLSVVLSQALCAGLPVIATDRTGAADLALTSVLAERIFLVPTDSADELAATIARVRDRLICDGPFAPLPQRDRDMLSWSAYGQRYHAALIANVSLDGLECAQSTS